MYWNEGLFDGSKMNSIYEVSSHIKEIDGKNMFERISTLSDETKTREAQKYFDYLKADLKSIDKSGSLGKKEELSKDLESVQTKLSKLNSLPRTDEVLSIFSSKLSKFISFVEFNKWRTLTRISKRVKSRIPSVTNVTVSNLKSRVRSILQDISIMRNVTSSSVLGQSEKNLINVKLDSLKTEMGIIQNYMDAYVPYSTTYGKFRKKYSKILKELGPNIALSKLKTIESTKQFSLGIFVIICFCVGNLFLGFALYQREKRRSQKYVEDHFLGLVKKGILAEKSEVPKSLGPDLRKEIFRTHEFLSKRMRYGQIFEATLPFSALLLDDNLKLVWGNETFFKDWEINDFKESQKVLSWDTLKRLTNLGETDPVIDANKSGMAGIFQIQVNLEGGKKPLPYEMYVNPVDNLGQRNIMIYFYPLATLEESLSEQVKTVMGPVNKSLTALMTNNFHGEVKDQIKNEFNNAGINDVYAKVENFYEQSNTQKQGLVDEIADLEEKLSSIMSIVNEIEAIHDEKKDSLNEGMYHLNETKKGVIQYVNFNARNERMYSSIFSGLKSILKNYTGLLKKAEEFHFALKDNLDVVESITSMRSEFKDVLHDAKAARLRLAQAVDQTLHFGKTRSVDIDRLSVCFGKVSSSSSDLEGFMEKLEKDIMAFDLNLTKAHLLVEGNHRDKAGESSIENLFENFKAISYKIENDMKNLQESFSKNRSLEEGLVENITIFDQYFTRSISEDNNVITLSHQVSGSSEDENEDENENRVEVKRERSPEPEVSV
jgi:hypothetical protein